MNTEEKAKAYDEALDKAKKIKSKILSSHLSTESCKAVSEYIDEIIPELRESEDERIRKDIINLIYWLAGNPSLCSRYYRDRYDGMLAYLEKQKELPFIKDVVLGLPGLYFYDGERMHFGGNPVMEENPYDFAMSQQEKQKEQKSNIELIQKSWYMEGYHDKEFNCEPKWIIKTGEGGPRYEENPKYGQIIEQKPVEYLSKDKVYAIMNKLTELSTSELIPLNSDEYKKINEITSDVRSLLDYPIEEKPVVTHGETYHVDTLGTQQVIAGKMPQKSADWSEEDEEIFNNIIEKAKGGHWIEVNEISWLITRFKSLSPQSKQEWSEEDEEMLNSCICSIEESKENRYAYKETDGDTSYDREIAWLKSLRSQPKQEWSKEDEKDIAHIIRILDDCCVYGIHDLSKTDHENLVNKLKSIRPQSKGDVYKEKNEAFKLGKQQLAIGFMNYLDDNRPKK